MSESARRRARPGHGYAVPPAMALMIVMVSGCATHPGGSGGGDRNQPAQVVAEYDCLAPNLGGWFVEPEFPGGMAPAEPSEPPRPDAPPPGRVPVGFQPVAAIRCDLMAAIEDADGRWSGVSADTLAGDLGPLLAALDQPDDGDWPGPCTADMELVPPLWLIDATGRAIHVHYPVDGCGKTKPAVREALAGLPTVETTTSKRRLTQSRAAIDAGCDAEFTAPSSQWLTLADPQVAPLPLLTAVPQEPIPVDPRAAGSSGAPSARKPGEVEGMRWCRYATPPGVPGAAVPVPDVPGVPVPVPDIPGAGSPELLGVITLRTGRFVSGGLLSEGSARQVLAAAEAGRDARTESGAGSAADAAPDAAPSAEPDAGAEPCDLASAAFIALWPLKDGDVAGSALTAELDGCGRLFSDGRDPRPIPADLRALLTALPAG